MKLRVKRVLDNAVIPNYATKGAAGFDLIAAKKEILSIAQIKYDTGLAFEIPEGHVGLLTPRSSIVRTPLRLGNSIGIIDSDYRGPVSFIYDHNGQFRPDYEVGDRIGQMIIVPFSKVEFEEVEELQETERGSGGYGSTGR